MPPDLTTRFELHLNFCDGCFTFIDQIRATAAVAGPLAEEEVPEKTRAQAARGVPRLEGRMTAYEFLADDGSGIFSRFDWPLPNGGPGGWVESEVDPCRSGVHACRVVDLP